MTKSTRNLITTVLAVVGILLILAGPAFNLLARTPSLFAAIACFVVAAAVGGLARQGGRGRT